MGAEIMDRCWVTPIKVVRSSSYAWKAITDPNTLKALAYLGPGWLQSIPGALTWVENSLKPQDPSCRAKATTLTNKGILVLNSQRLLAIIQGKQNIDRRCEFLSARKCEAYRKKWGESLKFPGIKSGFYCNGRIACKLHKRHMSK